MSSLSGAPKGCAPSSNSSAKAARRFCICPIRISDATIRFCGFFGIQTATITGLSRIAALANAKVIPAIPVREADNTVTLHFYPAWESFPSEDAQADAQRMNRFIEERVREHPEQYFWLHKRFKTRPEAQPRFLLTT